MRRENRRRPYGDKKPQMHSAVCDECGNSCQVPFKPTGEKPIYCSDCFEKKGNSSRGGDRRENRSGGRGEYRGGNNSRDMERKLDYIEDKLDRVLEILDEALAKGIKVTRISKDEAGEVLEQDQIQKPASEEEDE